MREHGLVNARREGSTITIVFQTSVIYEAIKLLREVQAEQIEKRRLLNIGN